MIKSSELPKGPRHGWEYMLDRAEAEVKSAHHLGRRSIKLNFINPSAENATIFKEKMIDAEYSIRQLHADILGTATYEVNWDA